MIAGRAEYSESTLRACIAESHGISTPARHRVCSRFNGSGEPLPRVFANLAIMHFGSMRVLVYWYADGTPEGLELLINQLPAIAHESGCHATDGCMPHRARTPD